MELVVCQKSNIVGESRGAAIKDVIDSSVTDKRKLCGEQVVMTVYLDLFDLLTSNCLKGILSYNFFGIGGSMYFV